MHRVNSSNQLRGLDTNYGVEVDLRSDGNSIIINHDPFKKGELFDDWIKYYKHKTLILNVKEEGLEAKLIEIMKFHEVTDYFFLDQTFPFLLKFSDACEKRCAARLSEFESIETVLKVSDKIKWVWVDCFNHFPIGKEQIQMLKKLSLNICVVSPELQGRDNSKKILEFKQFLLSHGLTFDAVCTKRPDIWDR